MISVIVPAHNEELYLPACLDSLIKQDLPQNQFEIIVVDNASTDHTAKVAKRYPVKLIHEPRKSVTLARQAGVNSSRGQIIASADADTVYPPHWLSQINTSFAQHPDIVALVGWIYYSHVPPWINLYMSLIQRFNLWLNHVSHHTPLVFAANFAFRRPAFDKTGGYPPHLPELGDQQYLLSHLQKTGPIIINPHIFCYTSSRKYSGNKWPNAVIFNIWHRIVGFNVNRALGRQIIHPTPTIR